MIYIFKKGVRGGISQCTTTNHGATNKFLAIYNHNEKSTFVTFHDVTNLYRQDMRQNIPRGLYTWLCDGVINFLI